MTISVFIQSIFSGLTTGSVYALIGIGITLIFRVSNSLNLMQGEYFTLGVLVVASGLAFGLPLPLAFLLAIMSAVLVGMIFERGTVHLVRKKDMLVKLMLSLAGALFMEALYMLIWGKSSVTLSPLPGPESITVAGASLSSQVLWIIGTALVLVIALNLFFKFSRFGKAVRACADNELASRLMGIPVRLIILFSYTLSAAIGAIAGFMIAPLVLVNFGTGLFMTIKGFIAAVFGGLNRPNGALLGGLTIGLIEAFGSSVISSQYKDTVVYTIQFLALIMIPLIVKKKGANI